MVFGGVRHGADIRADDLQKDGADIIGLQMGTNRYATQKGMVMGGVRHGADIRADDQTKDGEALIGLQVGRLPSSIILLISLNFQYLWFLQFFQYYQFL